MKTLSRSGVLAVLAAGVLTATAACGPQGGGPAAARSPATASPAAAGAPGPAAPWAPTAADALWPCSLVPAAVMRRLDVHTPGSLQPGTFTPVPRRR